VAAALVVPPVWVYCGVSGRVKSMVGCIVCNGNKIFAALSSVE